MAKTPQEAPASEVEATTTPEGTEPVATEAAEKPVKVVVREMFAEGKSRSEIAKALGISYQRVFSLTKGETNAATSGNGSRPKVILEGLEGDFARFNGVARIDAIRTLFGEGLKVGPIAKALGTSYQIVFQATRSLREQAATAETPEGEVEEGDESADTEAEGSANEPEDDEPEG